MNWKVRFRNKVWLTSFIATIVTFIYAILGMFDVFPAVTQNSVMNVVNAMLMVLCMMGVIIDPTTEGVSDSKRAMTYESPWVDPVYDEDADG